MKETRAKTRYKFQTQIDAIEGGTPTQINICRETLS